MIFLLLRFSFFMISISSFAHSGIHTKRVALKVYTPSDYSNHPEQTWNHFTKKLPKPLRRHLSQKYHASFITSCTGSYTSKNAQNYIVGFIEGKKNAGHSMMFSIDKKTMKVSSVLIKTYQNISSEIYGHIVPVVEVYCEKGFVISKTQENGLPAYTYDKNKKTFTFSLKHSASIEGH